MRKSQAQTLQKLRQRGAKTVSTKSNGPVQSGHAHGHRLNVAELKLHLKDVIWEKTQGDKGRIRRLFRRLFRCPRATPASSSPMTGFFSADHSA